MNKGNLKIAGTSAAVDCAAFLAKQKKLGVRNFNGNKIWLVDENGDYFSADVANVHKLKNYNRADNDATLIKSILKDFFGEDFTGKKFIDLVPYVEELFKTADEATRLNNLKFVIP